MTRIEDQPPSAMAPTGFAEISVAIRVRGVRPPSNNRNNYGGFSRQSAHVRIDVWTRRRMPLIRKLMTKIY